MEVKIGIRDIARELTLNTETDADELLAAFKTALDTSSLFEIKDDKGRRLVIPAGQVGYLDFGSADNRQVGFGTF